MEPQNQPAYYDIQVCTRHQEVRIEGGLSVALLREIIQKLSLAEGFADLHTLWTFGPQVRPIPFHEFDEVIGFVAGVYGSVPTSKKVALVVVAPFARATAQVFAKQAAHLPIDIRVFATRSEAITWLGV